MRLPIRSAGSVAVFTFLAEIAWAQAPPRPELSGGALTQAPPQITRIEATAPQTTEAAPQPLGYESEVHCFGYLGGPDERFIATVIGAENSAEQEDFTDNNLLFLDGGYDRGLRPGDEFWLVTPGDLVVHPMTGKTM